MEGASKEHILRGTAIQKQGAMEPIEEGLNGPMKVCSWNRRGLRSVDSPPIPYSSYLVRTFAPMILM